MRALLILFATLGLLTTATAADHIVKVLPFLLDAQGHDSTSPSLFDRDAYQAQLRQNTNAVSAIRCAVLWNAEKSPSEKIRLRAELRAVGERGVPKLKTLETEVTPRFFRQWTSLTLGGEEYKKFGAVVAWRVTLWRGDRQLDEKKSFLW